MLMAAGATGVIPPARSGSDASRTRNGRDRRPLHPAGHHRSTTRPGLAAVVLDANWLSVATTSNALRRMSNAWLPRNLFTFIAGQGFVTSGTAVAAACGGTILMEMALVGGPIVVPAAFTRASLLLGAGEALFTGLLTILITLYKPAWITTYDVRRYRLDHSPHV